MGTEANVLESTLKDACSYLTRAVEYLPLLTEELRRGERQQPVQELANLVEGLDWLGKLLESGVSLCGVEWGTWEVEEKPVASLLKAFNQVCRELEEALEESNYLYLADLLAEELPVALSQYQQLFQELLRVRPQEDLAEKSSSTCKENLG